MGNPLQTIPNLPPAIAVTPADQLWINQAGVDKRTTLGAALGSGGSGGAAPAVPNYGALRESTFPITTSSIVLADPYKGGLFVRAAMPSTLVDNGGTVIVDAGGQPWVRVFSGPVDAGWFYDGPGHLGDGYSAPGNTAWAITAQDQANNPQWIGLPPALGGGPYTVGLTWAYVALQQALYACFAVASTPGNVVWNGNALTLNLPFRCPPGTCVINQSLYFMAEGFDLTFAEKRASPIRYTGPRNQSPLMTDAVSYGAFHNLSFTDGAGTTGVPLIDLNWTGANPGLKTQQITFYDAALFGGYGADSVGVEIARSGGNSQGDTVQFINCIAVGFEYGIVAGGDNALSIISVGGNLQGCTKNGFQANGGSFFLYGPNFEAAQSDYHDYPQWGQIALDGADAKMLPGGGATSRCAVYDVRSENMVLSIDRAGYSRLQNCGMSQVGAYGWSAGGHQHIGMLAATNGAVNPIVMCVDDSGPAWFAADPSSTNTVIVVEGPSPNWAPGQWVGFSRWFRYGNGYCLAGGPVTASTANSLTDPNGWYQSETANPPLPPLAPGVLAGYYVKVSGVSGSTQPAWDTFPPGNATQPGAVGWGFTTYAGSNVISSASLTAGGNGQWVVVTDAIRVQQPPQTTFVGPGALIGKIQNFNPGASFTALLSAGGSLGVTAMTSGTIKVGAVLGGAAARGTVILSQTGGTPGGTGSYTVSNPTQPAQPSGPFSTAPAGEVVNSHGDPLPASLSLVDQPGYFGQGIPDGQITWLPIDFDVICGAASGDNIDPSVYGKFRNLGLVNFNVAMSASLLSRIRPQQPTPNYSLRAGGGVATALANTFAATGALNVTTVQLSQQQMLVFGVTGALTINMPIWLDNISQRFDLYMTSGGAGGMVVTWGANIKAGAPTVTMGAVGQLTLITLLWISTGPGAGFWYVIGGVGPL